VVKMALVEITEDDLINVMATQLRVAGLSFEG
jgi:hypothetical protein